MSRIKVTTSKVVGKLEWRRHTFGQGGINPLPLPQKVIEGIKNLRPRLIRIFIQEYFNIYTEDGNFNWELLDPYMSALAQTGAKIVACIVIKPRRIFPTIDQKIWCPTDVREWQRLIYHLVRRYSVEKPLVTYWEITNEPDIGEDGGTPYLIPDVKEYCEFYRMTVEAILSAFPSARVGGPALASVAHPLMQGLTEYCKETGTKLDFLSWHIYSDEPLQYAQGIESVKALLKDFPTRPEMLITEWNRSISQLSGETKDASIVSACLLSMLSAGVDWSFYYQIWDQVFYEEWFEGWFSSEGIEKMRNFWKDIPPFGLFDLEGSPRASYFLYKMLYQMGEEKLSVESDIPELGVIASRSQDKFTVLVTNPSPASQTLNLEISDLCPGKKFLSVYRIDEEMCWSLSQLELWPVEERDVKTSSVFSLSLYIPPYSVSQVILKESE